MTTTIQPPTPTRSLEHVVNGIASRLTQESVLTRGDAAALRRMDPHRPSAAFFKVEGLVLDDLLPGEAATRAALETKWAAIVIGLAHLGDLHRPGRRLGMALGEAGYPELRFERLLRADEDRLLDELPSLARYLAAKGLPADWADAARLILWTGEDAQESVRRHLARDYYRILAHAERA